MLEIAANILHTARSIPNTAFLHDAFGNVTNATDTAGNSWQFSYASLNILTNEVFISLRLCDSARQINALSRLVDTYSRSVGYNLAIDGSPHSRVRYGYDAEGRIATLAGDKCIQSRRIMLPPNLEIYDIIFGDRP